MIGCKVMRTLASVKIEIVLILGLPYRLSSSSVRCLESDPYEAIRQAYLDRTDTESEPFEDPIDTETPELPLTITPPISPSVSAPLVLVPILRRTARMAVRVPPTMSSGLSASLAEVAAMFESAVHKRFRSSYKSSPSVSPPDLSLRKRYRGTSELVEDSEEDDDEEDEEIDESMDSDSLSKDTEDEGPTAKDEDPAARDEGLTARVEGPEIDDESYGLDDESHEEEEEVVPGGQQQTAPIVGTAVSGSGSAPESERPERVSAFRQPTLITWTDPEDGMVYIDVPIYPPPAPPVQTPTSPEWTSGLLPISLSPSVIPSPISSPMTPLTIPSPVATPATAETKGFLTELGAQGENQDLQLQLAEERRVRLELAKVVDSMRRGQEPRGGAQFCPCVSALRLVARDRADTHFLIRLWHAMYLVYSVWNELSKTLAEDESIMAFFHLRHHLHGREHFQTTSTGDHSTAVDKTKLELKIMLESKPWISQRQMVVLLNKVTDIITLWQPSGGAPQSDKLNGSDHVALEKNGMQKRRRASSRGACN
ncbi:reverse transcriptase domain-containing protein, chloroplastic [Tanacetum coccineum]